MAELIDSIAPGATGGEPPARGRAPAVDSHRRLLPPRVDLVCCLVLAATTAIYAWLWPRDLSPFDEGMLLYEASRVRHGAVLYRDVFQIITPGFHYLFAAAFALFGASFAVARAAMVAVHVAIQCAIYLIARRLGARPWVAAAAALAELAVAYPAMPEANPHWLSTLGGLLLLLALLRRSDVRATWWIGIGCGLCLLVQQQRGTGLLFGVAGVQILNAWAGTRTWQYFARDAATRLALLGTAAVGTLVVGLLPIVLTAGADAVFTALVRFPAMNYRQYHNALPTLMFTLPGLTVIGAVVRAIPLVIPVALLRSGLAMWNRRPPEGWLPLATTAVVAAATTGSMWYFPGVGHLAVAAPATLVLVAELAEYLLPRGTVLHSRVWQIATPAAATATLVWILADNLIVRRQMFSIRRETAFGTVDFFSPSQAAAAELIARGLDDTRTREAFAYPYGASLYLEANAVNATRFQFLRLGYNDPAQIEEVIRTLEERQVPYVFVFAQSIDWKTDPVVQYLKQSYERVPLSRASDKGLYALFRRRNVATAATATPLER